MPLVTLIPGLGKSASSLLEAVGFSDLASLAEADAGDLHRQLVQANKTLRITKRSPSVEDIAGWIRQARELTDLDEDELPHETADAADDPEPADSDDPDADPTPEETPEPVNFEAYPHVQEMLIKARVAVPLPVAELVEQKIAVSDIPAAILLTSVVGDIGIRNPQRATAQPRSTRPASPQGHVQIGESLAPRRQLDVTKIRSVDEFLKSPADPTTPPATTVPAPAQKKPSNEDRLHLLRTPREETNRGRNPESRNYIRGVLHNQPVWILLTAITTLICYALIPLSVISGTLLLLSDQFPKKFHWVPAWLLVFPLFLPLFGILYGVLASGAKCRVCGQKICLPQQCRKNAKAHHLPGLGHIIPLCLHVLLFRWFRCTFCGTPVRIKE